MKVMVVLIPTMIVQPSLAKPRTYMLWEPTKEDLKGITTRSGTTYQGPTIPTTSSSVPQVVERETEVTKDMVPHTNNRSTKDIQPLVIQIETLMPNSEPVVAPVIEPVVAPVSALNPNQKLSIPYQSRLPDQKLRDKTNDQKEVAEDVFVNVGTFHFPADFIVVHFDADPRVPLILGRSFLKIERALIDVFEGELTLHVGKEAITFNLDRTSRYLANYNDMTANRIDVIDMACEEYSQEVLGFSDMIASCNPTPYYDPIVSTSSSTLTSFSDSDFLLEEVDAFLALEDDATSLEELKICEAKTDKSSIDEPPKVELKDLPPHLEYAFLEGDDKFPVIIAKDLSDEEKTALIKVLKSHKLCNAPGTFQRCMMVIFHDMIEKTMEVFMDDFLVFGNSFKTCLSHLEKMLKRCEDTNLCLNWEKSHFMVKEGIVLGHKISKNGIEVDKAKVDVVTKLPHPITVKGIHSFLGYADFYRRFIQDFLKIARPMTRLLEKAKALPTNDARVVCKFLKSLFARFGTPVPSSMIAVRTSAMTSLQRSCLSTMSLTALLPRIILRLVEKVQLNELNELHDQAYENSLINKEKTKRLHDSKIKDRVFSIGDRVILFNSRLKIFLGKLKTRWSGAFTITHVFPYGTVELSQTDGPNFKVNGHRLKHYFGEDIPKMVVPDLQTFPKD
nr:reverse transcriptase domain-containing protein [Tanacetum cinerariifolium]